jgi:hypothetical protein
MDLCAVSRWYEGCRNKGKAQLNSALDRISERITLAFQILFHPDAIRGRPSKNNNLPYIPIRYGGGGVSQSPLKDQVFLTFLGQNPPFELRRKLALRLQSFHEIHGGSSKCCPSISVGGGQQGWLAFAPEGKASCAISPVLPNTFNEIGTPGRQPVLFS